MTKIIDRTGKGSAISQAENDANLSSLSGINESQTGTTHTIDVNDQCRTIEYSNASSIAVTLPAIADVSGANIHTDDFKVTLKNIGAGVVTATRSSTDTFDNGDTSFALNQYSWVTIQTDSTLGVWNIIAHGNSDVSANATAGTMLTSGDKRTVGSGTVLTTDDYKTSGSGDVITDNDFATGTVTFSSIAATTNSGQTDVAHGLGTDDIDFGFSLRFDGTIANLDEITGLGVTANDAAVWNGRDGKTMPNPVSTPSAGYLGFNVRNNHGTVHTIYVDWWARIR